MPAEGNLGLKATSSFPGSEDAKGWVSDGEDDDRVDDEGEDSDEGRDDDDDEDGGDGDDEEEEEEGVLEEHVGTMCCIAMRL